MEPINMDDMDLYNNPLTYTNDIPSFDPIGSIYQNITLEPGWEQTTFDWDTLESKIDWSADWYPPLDPTLDIQSLGNWGVLPEFPTIQNDYPFSMDRQLPFTEWDDIFAMTSHQEPSKWSATPSIVTAPTSSATSSPQLQTPTNSDSMSPLTTISSQELSSTSSLSRPRPSSKARHTFTCPNCAKPYSARHLLNRHIRTHTLPTTCPHTDANGTLCSVRKPNAREMERHIATAHTKQRKGGFCPFTDCKQSIEGFARKDHRTRHLKMVHGVHPADVS